MLEAAASRSVTITNQILAKPGHNSSSKGSIRSGLLSRITHRPYQQSSWRVSLYYSGSSVDADIDTPAVHATCQPRCKGCRYLWLGDLCNKTYCARFCGHHSQSTKTPHQWPNATQARPPRTWSDLLNMYIRAQCPLQRLTYLTLGFALHLRP